MFEKNFIQVEEVEGLKIRQKYIVIPGRFPVSGPWREMLGDKERFKI